MCGLAGFCVEKDPSTHDIKALAAIRESLVKAAAQRGTDSYGGVFLDSDGKHVQVIRGLGSIVPQIARIPLRAQAVMLHTRSRTTGEVSVRNAHPFSHKGILGMHNGVVSNHWSLRSKDNAEYRVDSEALIARIGKGEDAGDVDAWGAVTWVSEEKPQEGVYLCRFSGGSLDCLTGRLPSGGLCTVWASAMPRDISKVLEELQPWIVESGKVFQAVAGRVGITRRELKVGSRVTKTTTSYNSSKITKGPNGEVIPDWAMCTCGDDFERHSCWTQYGGLCTRGPCHCKKFELDAKATGEIQAQRAEKAKRLAAEAAAKASKEAEKKPVQSTVVVEKQTCVCNHDRFNHRKGKKHCLTAACQCNKFLLAASGPLVSNAVKTSDSKARWDKICDAETAEELRHACFAVIVAETGCKDKENCPDSACTDTSSCKACLGAWQEMIGIYQSMKAELEPKEQEGAACEVQFERTTQPGAGQASLPAKAVESKTEDSPDYCGKCGKLWSDCLAERPVVCINGWKAAKGPYSTLWCQDCGAFWKAQHADDCAYTAKLKAWAKDPVKDEQGVPIDISAKLENMGQEAAKVHQERMGNAAAPALNARLCGHEICKLNMACLPGHCPEKREHLPPNKRTLS